MPTNSKEPRIKKFYPLKRSATKKSILAFDVEGIGGPGGFVCGAIAGEYTSGFYTDRQEMWNDVLHYGLDGTWIFAHNLEYDLPIVASDDLWKGKLVFKQSGILWGDYRVRDRRVRFYDSSNLFPYWSVAYLGEILGKAKHDLPDYLLQRLGKGEDWNTFTEKEQETIRYYCIRDAEIVALAVSMLQDQILEIGGQLKPTLAGIAMDVFRRTFMKWPWQVLPEKVNEVLRPAYYGGRVENYAFGKVQNVNLYDINSLYPYILRHASFPHPDYLQHFDGSDALRFLDYGEGVASATVTVQDIHSPPLPFRTEGKLFFPTGELTSYWTTGELRYALSNGAELKTLDWIVGSKVTFNPFEDFIDTLYSLRGVLRSQGDRRQILIKLIMNSLYGRFGINPEKGLVQMMKMPDHLDFNDVRGWHMQDFNGTLVLMGPMNFRGYPNYANVMFASQVSADARIVLHNSLVSHGKNTMYCDTDSVLSTSLMATGGALGEWKAQMIGGQADLIGPKEYSLHNKVTDIKHVVKGVPTRAKEEYLKKGSARYRKAVKIREAISQGLNPAEWVEIIKVHHPTLPKRRPVLPEKSWTSSYCLSSPWAISDLHSALELPIEAHFQREYGRGRGFLAEWVAPVYVEQ